jgi:hypothetical protein
MAKPSLEQDGPYWPEPFAAMNARIRYQSYILLGLVAVIALLGVLLFDLGSKASAHVYEVMPNGAATYIGDRESNVAPRPAEATYVARRFIELLYSWNSSTVVRDVTDAANLCSQSMADELRKELATAQFIDAIRKRNIRSETSFGQVDVIDHNSREFRVRLAGKTDVYGLAQYAGTPIDTRQFSFTVVLSIVPRDPELRLNGLEIVRIERGASTINSLGATP